MTNKTRFREPAKETQKNKSRIIGSLFSLKNIPDDAREILENFDQIVQGALPANSRQLLLLPKQIRELSHQMTDERETRRMGYMNDKVFLAAYTRYFMWWNLVRLVRLFANLDFSFLKDGDFCLDIGSGPLTVITALWLSHPELRQKKITWYALDISQLTLTLGEELFLNIAAKTSGEAAETEPWKIVRVKGELGTTVREKCDFVTCANVFNEILQSKTEPPDFLAKKYSAPLFKYLAQSGGILLIEPGVPKSARFVSLMRDAFLRNGFFIQAPCPHSKQCPMDGRRQNGRNGQNTQSGANGKWCNFAFNTDNAPKNLLALSKSAGIPKERAVLSFVFAQKEAAASARPDSTKPPYAENTLRMNTMLRIVSDTIWLPSETAGGKKSAGHYACAEDGFTLAVSKSGRHVHSGDLVLVSGENRQSDRSFKNKNAGKGKSKDTPDFRQQFDAKTGAIIKEI